MTIHPGRPDDRGRASRRLGRRLSSRSRAGDNERIKRRVPPVMRDSRPSREPVRTRRRTFTGWRKPRSGLDRRPPASPHAADCRRSDATLARRTAAAILEWASSNASSTSPSRLGAALYKSSSGSTSSGCYAVVPRPDPGAGRRLTGPRILRPCGSNDPPARGQDGDGPRGAVGGRSRRSVGASAHPSG